MATRYRRRLYGNTYYGRRNYRRYTSKAGRVAKGNYRAASQQKDATQVNLNVMHKCTTKYTLDAVIDAPNTVKTGVYALNIWDLLRRSEFYQSYANMYDQVKIDRIRIKLTPVNWSFNSQVNGMKALTIVTAWDRTGLSDEQVKLKLPKDEIMQIDFDGTVGKDNDSNGLYVLMNDEIATYSSAQTRNLNPGSSLSITRMLYPSSLNEKAFYVNTSDLDSWYTKYDPEKSRYWGFKFPNLVYGNPKDITSAYETDDNVSIGFMSESPACKGNPCYLLEDPTIPFKPTLLIGVLTSSNLANANIGENIELENPVTFNLEADIGVTFRGLRKAKIVP